MFGTAQSYQGSGNCVNVQMVLPLRRLSRDASEAIFFCATHTITLIEKLIMPNNSRVPVPVKTPKRIKRLAYLLDSAIPLPGGRSIGLEAIIGLIPGVGDIIGALASCYIVAEGVRMGAPKRVVMRMIGNVLIESTIGVVPLVGDLFDMVYKSNMRNIGMLLELEKASEVTGYVQQPIPLQPDTMLSDNQKEHANSPQVAGQKKSNRLIIWMGLAIAVLLLVTVIWLVFQALLFIVGVIV